MNKIVKSSSKMQGWTEMRHIDTTQFLDALRARGVRLNHVKIGPSTLTNAYIKGLKHGLTKSHLNFLLDSAAKPLFKTNFIWKFLKEHFELDLRIPLLLGYWTLAPLKMNTVTDVGKSISAGQVGGVTTAPVTAIAIGVGTPSTTALGSESTTNGGSRGAATTSRVTTTVTNDTAQWVKTFTFTGSLALTEEGLFDNNTSGGNMLASQSFSAVNVVNTDTLQVTHKVKYA